MENLLLNKEEESIIYLIEYYNRLTKKWILIKQDFDSDEIMQIWYRYPNGWGKNKQPLRMRRKYVTIKVYNIDTLQEQNVSGRSLVTDK